MEALGGDRGFSTNRDVVGKANLTNGILLTSAASTKASRWSACGSRER